MRDILLIAGLKSVDGAERSNFNGTDNHDPVVPPLAFHSSSNPLSDLNDKHSTTHSHLWSGVFCEGRTIDIESPIWRLISTSID